MKRYCIRPPAPSPSGQPAGRCPQREPQLFFSPIRKNPFVDAHFQSFPRSVPPPPFCSDLVIIITVSGSCSELRSSNSFLFPFIALRNLFSPPLTYRYFFLTNSANSSGYDVRRSFVRVSTPFGSVPPPVNAFFLSVPPNVVFYLRFPWAFSSHTNPNMIPALLPDVALRLFVCSPPGNSAVTPSAPAP